MVSKYEKINANPGTRSVLREIVGQMMEMYYGQEKSITEISKTTGISVTTTSRYLSLAIPKLKSDSTEVITRKSKIND